MIVFISTQTEDCILGIFCGRAYHMSVLRCSSVNHLRLLCRLGTNGICHFGMLGYFAADARARACKLRLAGMHVSRHAYPLSG